MCIAWFSIVANQEGVRAMADTGMEKAEMKRLLTRSKSEPVNCAIAQGEARDDPENHPDHDLGGERQASRGPRCGRRVRHPGRLRSRSPIAPRCAATQPARIGML